MKLLRSIFYLLNPRQRRLARWLWFLPVDLISKKVPLVPPKRLIYTGAGDFVSIGNKMFLKIIEECDFKSDEKILDIGCGIGRIARPFSKFLNNEGEYYGFDVVEPGVAWCREHYQQFSGFHFDYASVNNELYNNTAHVNDWEYTFSYDDQFFDLVVSISVFTHMQQRGVKNYFSEIGRVLKSGRYCFATFFIMNEERKLKFESGNSFFKFKDGDQYLHDRRVKDANVAFDYGAVEEMAATSGLTIKKFLPGWWDDDDKKGKFDFQDVAIMKKR